MNKKQRIITWLSIFLLVINISAFSTLLLMNKQGGDSEKKSNEHYKSDEFLKEYLDLSDEQYKEISSLDQRLFRAYQSILDMQCESNFKLMEQLSSKEPNIHVMDSIARRIGNLNAGLKRQTIKHFMNIRGICTAEQSHLLEQLIKDMMKLDDQCKNCNKEYCPRRESIR